MKRGMMFCVILFSGLAFSQQARLLRLEVISEEQEGTQLNMSIPISVIASFQGVLDDSISEIDLDELRDINFADIWKAVKDAGPNEYVEVTHDRDSVKVFTTKSHLEVRSTDESEHQIYVSLPFELCDVLFVEPHEFDLDKLVERLNGLVGEDLVRIVTPDARVRVWVE